MKMKGQIMADNKLLPTAPTGNVYEEGNTLKDLTEVPGEGVKDEEGDGIDPFTGDPTNKEWGAADISKDDFINPDGTPKTIQEVYTTLDTKLPGITGKELYNQINEMMPKYQGVAAEEKGFLATERGFAERGAEATREGDIYGLQKGAGKVGAQQRGAYSGMGGAARGAIGGQAAIQKGFGTTMDAYGLSMEKAKVTEEKGLYGLGKGAAEAYEADIAAGIDPTWLTVGEKGATEGFQETTEFGAWSGREGGRVPSKESFSNFLTQLPDAGGV